MRRQLLNNVNTRINFSTADNESKTGNLNIYSYIIKVVVPTATATFATSDETFSVSQTLSLSSSKVEDTGEVSPKRKESISGNRIIDVNILLVVFLVTCYALNVWPQFLSSLWKIWEKIRTIIIVVSKMLQQ